MRSLTLILSIFLSFNLFSIDEKTVLDRLTWDHGPEWNTLLRESNKKDILTLRSILFKISDNKINFKSYPHYKNLKTYLASMAMSELGNFALVDGSDGSETLEYLRKKIEANKQLFQINEVNERLSSLIKAVNDIGTPEALNLLTEYLGEGSEVYDFAILDSISHGLKGWKGIDINTDFKSKRLFQPNTYEKYTNRGMDFDEAIKNYRFKLGDIIKDNKASELLRKTARLENLEIANQTIKPLKQRAPSSYTYKPSSSSPKKNKRSISSIEESDEPEEDSKLPIIVIFGLLLLVFIFVLYKKKQ